MKTRFKNAATRTLIKLLKLRRRLNDYKYCDVCNRKKPAYGGRDSLPVLPPTTKNPVTVVETCEGCHRRVAERRQRNL